MCNCIDEINMNLRKKFDDPQAALSTGFTFSGDTVIERPQGLTVLYRKKKKDGTFQDRKIKGYLCPTYCPFCGKRYIDEKPEQTEPEKSHEL